MVEDQTRQKAEEEIRPKTEEDITDKKVRRLPRFTNTRRHILAGVLAVSITSAILVHYLYNRNDAPIITDSIVVNKTDKSPGAQNHPLEGNIPGKFIPDESLENKLNEIDLSITPDRIVAKLRESFTRISGQQVSSRGLAASQSRLLMLSETKNDLTFRAQVLNAKIQEITNKQNAIDDFLKSILRTKITDIDDLIPYIDNKAASPNLSGDEKDILRQKKDYLTVLKPKLKDLEEKVLSAKEPLKKQQEELDKQQEELNRQFKVVEEEVNSIKKVIDKNIESSFRFFD